MPKKFMPKKPVNPGPNSCAVCGYTQRKESTANPGVNSLWECSHVDCPHRKVQNWNIQAVTQNNRPVS